MNTSEEIIRAHQVLKKGGVILYPTDTIWGIGCDATNVAAVNKIFAIKERRSDKHMLILLDQVEKLSMYIDHIPLIAWDLIESATRPTTFIYQNVKNLPSSLIAPDGSIAIRIVKNEFCQKLISLLGRPIISTSANISGTPNPITFNDINEWIKSKMDYIVNPQIGVVSDSKPSTIIRFIDDYNFQIVRE